MRLLNFLPWIALLGLVGCSQTKNAVKQEVVLSVPTAQVAKPVVASASPVVSTTIARPIMPKAKKRL